MGELSCAIFIRRDCRKLRGTDSVFRRSSDRGLAALDDSIEYRGFQIAVRVKQLPNGRFRAEHVVTPSSEDALAVLGGVPRLCSAAEIAVDGPDPEFSARLKTIEAGKAFVDVLYDSMC